MKATFKAIFLLISFLLTGRLLFSQRFNTTTALPLDLDGGNYSTCASPGTKALSFSVSGLPTVLSSNFALASINLTFDASCGGNFRPVGLYIKSPPPSSKCMKIYDGLYASQSMLSSATNVTFALRDGSCLEWPDFENTWEMPNNVSGNSGVFRAGDPANPSISLSGYFNGINPNGTWTIYAFESTSGPPCVKAASLTFGNPNVLDRLNDGETCAGAIEWNGLPLCAQTTGKDGSTEMPGSIGGDGSTDFGTINGATCDWNNANNNDVWIKFRATAGGTMCLTISSLKAELQSIVVTDNNTNDTDPCTQIARTSTNDPNWKVASCPRTSNAIYGSTAGSPANQQHCFAAENGKTYYLVVDGNGGQQTPFYVSGLSGPFEALLPLQFLSFDATCISDFVSLKWKTNSDLLTDYFVIEKSLDSRNWTYLMTTDAYAPAADNSFNEYTAEDRAPSKGIIYYRLRQVDRDGKFTFSPSRSVIIKQATGLSVFPNPGKGICTLSGLERGTIHQIRVLDVAGKLIHSSNTNADFYRFDISGEAPGVYFIQVDGKEHLRFVNMK